MERARGVDVLGLRGMSFIIDVNLSRNAWRGVCFRKQGPFDVDAWKAWRHRDPAPRRYG